MRPRLLRKQERRSIETLAEIIASRDETINDLKIQLAAEVRRGNAMQNLAYEAQRGERRWQTEANWIYCQLRDAQKMTDNDRMIRVTQLAARVNVEGRQYEGPEAL
jgi:hypothetical protein